MTPIQSNDFSLKPEAKSGSPLGFCLFVSVHLNSAGHKRDGMREFTCPASSLEGPYPANVGFCRASCRRLSLGLRQTDDSYSAWKDPMAAFSGTLVAFRCCLSIAPPICMELGNQSSLSCSRCVAARSAATPGQTWSDAAKPAGSCAILPPGGQFHQISLNFSQVSAWHRSTNLFPTCNR